MNTDLIPKLLSPLDAARRCQRSTLTIKRIADELGLPRIRTVGGVRLFTEEQVERIKAEISHRGFRAGGVMNSPQPLFNPDKKAVTQ